MRERVSEILGGIVFIGVITAVLSHPKTADLIDNIGKAFSNSVAAVTNDYALPDEKPKKGSK